LSSHDLSPLGGASTGAVAGDTLAAIGVVTAGVSTVAGVALAVGGVSAALGFGVTVVLTKQSVSNEACRLFSQQ